MNTLKSHIHIYMYILYTYKDLDDLRINCLFYSSIIFSFIPGILASYLYLYTSDFFPSQSHSPPRNFKSNHQRKKTSYSKN